MKKNYSLDKDKNRYSICNMQVGVFSFLAIKSEELHLHAKVTSVLSDPDSIYTNQIHLISTIFESYWYNCRRISERGLYYSIIHRIIKAFDCSDCIQYFYKLQKRWDQQEQLFSVKKWILIMNFDSMTFLRTLVLYQVHQLISNTLTIILVTLTMKSLAFFNQFWQILKLSRIFW